MKKISGLSVVMAALIGFSTVAAAKGAREVLVYKDPSCGCCSSWASHLAASKAFAPKAIETVNMSAIKTKLKVPQDLASCHTAVVAGYVVEGHVPAADIKQLLAMKRSNIIGLAVPGMPAGSPGMDAGGRRDPYTVYAFDSNGRRWPFAQHN